MIIFVSQAVGMSATPVKCGLQAVHFQPNPTQPNPMEPQISSEWIIIKMIKENKEQEISHLSLRVLGAFMMKGSAIGIEMRWKRIILIFPSALFDLGHLRFFLLCGPAPSSF
jgi:hypothetical protein